MDEVITAGIFGSRLGTIIFSAVFSQPAYIIDKIFCIRIQSFPSTKQLIAKKKQVFANNHLKSGFFRLRNFQNLLELCYKDNQSLGLMVILNPRNFYL